MANRVLFSGIIIVLFPFFVFSQAFDHINDLVKERDAMLQSYEKSSAQAKASKSKKPAVELQAALEKLMAKDAEIIREINTVQSFVLKEQREMAMAAKSEKDKLKNKSRPSGKADKALNMLIDSLYEANAFMQVKMDSLLAGTLSISSMQESLTNDLKTTVDEKGLIQKELDNAKTDKFILARRNMILLYFNMGVGVLLFAALVFMLLSFRKRKKATFTVSVQDLSPSKPRPITGFNQSIPKIAFEAFDSRVEKIEKLGKLREKGLLSEEEFLIQKQQILSSKPDK